MLNKRFPKLKSRLGVLEMGAGPNRGVLSSSYKKIEVLHSSLLGLSVRQLASHEGLSVVNSERMKLDHKTSLVRSCFFVNSYYALSVLLSILLTH